MLEKIQYRRPWRQRHCVWQIRVDLAPPWEKNEEGKASVAQIWRNERVVRTVEALQHQPVS